VNSLTDLAGLGSVPERQQARRIAAFQKKWRYQLRRMVPGSDFTWLAAELLDVATQALAEPQRPEISGDAPQLLSNELLSNEPLSDVS
jgi:hypothetical protein